MFRIIIAFPLKFQNLIYLHFHRNIQKYIIFYYQERRISMSHFISGLSVSPEPILDKAPLKNIVSPKFKHLLKEEVKKQSKHNDSWKQQIAISNLCKKLSDREYVILRKNNASQIQHHFAKLRWKLKRQASPNSISVAKFFDGDQQSTVMDVKCLMQKMPQKIHLQNKYNTKLVNYAETIHHARKISHEKQNYVRWLNKHNNSPIKSPNYCRMSFVLQRLQASPRSIINNDNSFLAPIKNDGYKPQIKRIKTLQNDFACVKR